MEFGAGVWFLAALIVGIVAAREFGRSGPAWFFLAIILTPLIGVLLFVLPPRRVPCPYCAEPIKPSASVCRFCNRTLPPTHERTGSVPIQKLLLALLLLIGIGWAATRCNYDIQWRKKTDPPVHVRLGCLVTYPGCAPPQHSKR